MLASWSRRLSGEKKKTRGKKSKARFPMAVSPKTDKWLRYLKYVVLVVILVFSTWTIYPPLHDLCPARAIFSFHWNTSLLGIVLVVFIVSSMLVKRFSCKYICPLGAFLAIFNKVAPIHLKADMTQCTNCGRCDSDCPMDISPIPENLNNRSVECIQCLDCIDTCAQKDTLTLRVL
jgi:polyferredoxin